MKVLVLGGTGFIGRNMVERFLALGHDVHATYFNGVPYHGPVWHQVDLRAPCFWLMKDVDVVIQAAATTSGSKDITARPYIHVTDNAVMNSHIMRAAFEAKVKHVIFFSCVTMFREGHVKEDSPIDIHPKYFGVAQTKLYIEKLCEFYAGILETKFTVIRHSNCYGPYDKFDLERSHVFGATVTKTVKATDKIMVWGTGEESRDLLYISDLCDFVVLALDNQKENFSLYNCGYGVAFKIKDLVQKIIDGSGKSIAIEHDLSAPHIPTSLSLDCSKAQKELGWNPKITLPEGIKKTLEWYNANCG